MIEEKLHEVEAKIATSMKNRSEDCRYRYQ